LQRVGAIATRVERRRSRRERARRTAQIAPSECHLGLRYDAAGARAIVFATEGAGGAAQ
jgi:hypothetical protein